MFTTFSAIGPVRTHVTDALVGAHAGDPVVPDSPAQPRAARTRSAVASALQLAAHRISPSPAC